MNTGADVFVGRGVPAWEGPEVEGTLVEIIGPEDVLDLLDQDMSEVIVLIHSAGTSMLTPVFADLKGVLCTTGGAGSHVAIISREFGVPCVMKTELTETAAVGTRVRVLANGQIFRTAG